MNLKIVKISLEIAIKKKKRQILAFWRNKIMGTSETLALAVIDLKLKKSSGSYS